MLEPSPGAGGRRAFDPVVVYAPLRRDGPALVELLAREELDVTLCTTLMELGVALEAPVGMFVFTQEAFSGDMLNLLQPWLEAQEAWSEPPVLALIDPRQHGRARGSHIAEALPNATSIVLERPVRALELLSSVRISLATRRRQLDLRDQFLLQADLLRELSHRVKNALANVYAVYRLTYRHAEDLPSFGKVFEARLQALSRVHELLTSSGWQGADLKAMARETLRPYAETTEAATDGVETLAGAGTGRVSLTGPSVPLPPRQALSAALTLHELAVNAARHGALSISGGQVDIAWQLEETMDDAILTLRWTERGGPPVRPPESAGFGTTFIRASLASEADGTVAFDFQPGGLACLLRFRVDRAG